MASLLTERCIASDFESQKSAHADVLNPILYAIRGRTAQVRLVVLDTAKASPGFREALALASQAVLKSSAPAVSVTSLDYTTVLPPGWQGCRPVPGPALDVPKVTVVVESFTTKPLRTKTLKDRPSHCKRSSAAKIRSANKRALADATPRSYWRIIKQLRNGAEHRIPLPIEDLSVEFEKRMQAGSCNTENFDALRMELAQLRDNEIPPMTRDPSEGRCFSRPVTAEDVEQLKSGLREKSPRSAVGIDDISYQAIISIPTERLVELFNTCVRQRDIPSLWLQTILIGILKAKRPGNEAASYRAIAFECCFLKMFTLLIEGRLREWCEQNDFLPPTQNGFRPGYRTSNNITS